MLPLTVSEVKVPTAVILIWLAVSRVPAILLNTPLVAPILPTLALPVTFNVVEPVMAPVNTPAAAPRLPTLALPVTLSEVKVPTEVILA